MTFSTTFLGHQGWLLRSDNTCILVDPLLREEFGTAHALGYRVFPPRAWSLDALPPVDAVVLSHEHDDHFDLPSLAKLDRNIPIYLSSRSSRAASTILREMGFAVRPLEPGGKAAIGELDVLAFCGDHVNSNCGEEWDTLPYVVRHRGGSGSLFSMVDIPIMPVHVEWVRAVVSRPGLVTWTNNSLDWSHMTDWLPSRAEATNKTFMKMGTGHKLILGEWGTPAAMLMCAGGFSFDGDRAWLNRRAFCVDNEAVCKAMTNIYKKEKFVVARPGQTVTMKNNRLDKIEDRAPFLGTTEAASWPSRVPEPAPAPLPDYAPATGRTELRVGELDELRGRLDDFAGELVGGSVFRGLCSMLATEHPKVTIAFVARDGDRRHAFVYEPANCRFVDAGDPPGTLAGLECWASDLLAVLRGDLGPIALSFGRSRLWNAGHGRFKFNIFDELNRVSHPLRRADAYLATYRRLAAPVMDSPIEIRARS